jgi:outer membrane receptor for ferrienterochelin and colicin
LANGKWRYRNPLWNVTRPTNAEKAEIYGVETGFNWEFVPDWKFGINYTWTNTEIKDKVGIHHLTILLNILPMLHLNGRQMTISNFGLW